MGNLRNIMGSCSGMRFMVEELAICSAAGRRLLLSEEMMTDSRLIEKEMERLSGVIEIVRNEQLSGPVEGLRHALSELHDIHGTLNSLANADNLDDIGLFEIKHFSLLSEKVRIFLTQTGHTVVGLPDLQEVVNVLDPDKQELSQFYIYPAYSPELVRLRKKQQLLYNENPKQSEIVRQQCLELEDEIRRQLSLRLFRDADKLQQAHERLAVLDILFAKALQAVKMGLCRPQPVQGATVYHGLFNPLIKQALEQKHKVFQAVDVKFDPSPCLITGANMAGKTVLLKTAALAQYLFQFGFFVPAAYASIAPVDDILFSMGDEQSELSGLSSFAAEMLNINRILQTARSGKNILALIDEPARTTNPEEGRAIVNALTDLLVKLGVRSLITTHYSNITASCRKLRVKGLVTGKMNEKLTIQNINNFMDYALLEHDADDVPLEALRIASILGIDDELIENAGHYLEQN